MVNEVLTVIAALAAAGFGAGVVKLLPVLSQWVRDWSDVRRLDETSNHELQRIHRIELIDNYEKLIERLHKEYDESKRAWSAERSSILGDRDRLNDENRRLIIDNARMQDTLINYQGIGSEAAERMDPVLMINRFLVICWANEPTSAFLGYPLATLVGQPITKILPPNRHDPVRKIFRRMIDRFGEIPETACLRHFHSGTVLRRDGSNLNVSVTVHGFRVPEPVSIPCNCGKPVSCDIHVIVFRVHLRQRWGEDVSPRDSALIVSVIDDLSSGNYPPVLDRKEDSKDSPGG